MSCRLAKSYGFIKLLMKLANGSLRFPDDGFSAFHSYSTTRNKSMSVSSSSTNTMAGEEANGGVTLLAGVEDNAQGSEIEAALWMPWEEYTKQPYVQNHELLRHMTDICSAKTNGDYEGFTPLRCSAFCQQGNMYINTRDLHSRH